MPLALSRAVTGEIQDTQRCTPQECRENLMDIELLSRLSRVPEYVTQAVDKIITTYGLASPSILDIGSGSGGLLLSLNQHFAKVHAPATLIGIDVNPQAVALARRRTRGRNSIVIDRADVRQLPNNFRAEIVICVDTLHHFRPNTITTIIKELYDRAYTAVILIDLVRSWPTLLAAYAATRLVTWNRLTWHDGPLSVRRSLSMREVRELMHQTGLLHYDVSHVGMFRYGVVMHK